MNLKLKKEGAMKKLLKIDEMKKSLRIDEWDIKTISQVIYMCSAIAVAYAALEGANALRSQADIQWLDTKDPTLTSIYLSEASGIELTSKDEIKRAIKKLIDKRK